jgi:RNA polymerase sigma-70 factor (ECF subfamily)
LNQTGGHINDAQQADEALLEAYRKLGEPEYLAELYRRHLHLALGVCMKYLKDAAAAQDAVADVFEKLAKDLRDREVEQFKPWLYTVTKNHCLQLLRKEQVQVGRTKEYTQFLESVMETEVEPHLHKEDEKELLLQRLETSIEALNPDQRQCIVLFYIEGKSYKEIVDQMGLTDMQVKSHIQNGKRNLKNLIEKRP